MEEVKELTMKNQPGKIKRSGAGVAQSSTHGLLQRIALLGLQLENPKNRPWRWCDLNPKQRRYHKMHQQRKRANFCRQRTLGRVKNQMRGHQQEIWYKIWMLRQWGNWGWVLNGSFWSEETLDHIVSSAGLYRIVRWIVSYPQLDRIVSDELDRIVSAGSGNTGFYALAGYWLDGTDGLDGVLVGRGWDGPSLAPAGTGAPPWEPEQERHWWLLRGGGLW